MSQAHLLLQAIYAQINRATSAAPYTIGALKRATPLTIAAIRQGLRALAKQGLVDRGVDGEIRLTLSGLAVAVAGIDPQPIAATRYARRVAYAA